LGKAGELKGEVENQRGGAKPLRIKIFKGFIKRQGKRRKGKGERRKGDFGDFEQLRS